MSLFARLSRAVSPFPMPVSSLIAMLLAPAMISASALAQAPQVQRIFPPGGSRGQTVDVELKGKLADAELQVWSNRPGLTWQSKEEPGKFRVVIEPDAEPGLYLVRFYDAKGASSLQRFVVGSSPEISEQEPNDRVDQSQSIETTPLLINGVLEKGDDVDLYAVQLKAGSTLVAALEAERLLKSPVDACLQIVDEKANVLAMNLDYHGLDPLLTWTAPRDGRFGVRVFGFPSAPDSTIRLAGSDDYVYRLTLTAGPYLEATLPLAISATEPTVLQPRGWNLDASSASLSVQPGAAANAAGRQGHWVSLDGASGSLQVPIVDCPIHVAPSQTAEAPASMVVTIPSSITGCLSEPNAEDTFVFKVKKGERLVASIESRSLGYPLDAMLRIHSIEGKQLTREDDTKTSRDPVMRWTAPEDGEYRIIISEVNGMAVRHGYYRLSLAHESPSFTVTTTGDLVTGKVNEPLPLTLAITRQNGFDGRLTFKLVDAPQGLTAAAVTSEAKGDTAKEVKWSITATEPFNGPIRVAITSEGGGADASSPALVVASDSQLEDLWLVALP